MRKSTALQKLVNGNASKHDAYREAWSRIRLAKENEFFLEAITIQESIINDRLIGYLARSTASRPISKNKRGQWPSFGELLQHWRSEFPNALQSGSYTDLISAVDQWRNLRNEAIHAIVKSDPGQPLQPIDVFLEKAKKAAEDGEFLAKEVSSWCRKQKRANSNLDTQHL